MEGIQAQAIWHLIVNKGIFNDSIDNKTANGLILRLGTFQKFNEHIRPGVTIKLILRTVIQLAIKNVRAHIFFGRYFKRLYNNNILSSISDYDYCL